MKKNACQMPISFLYMQRVIGPGSEKKRYFTKEDSPQGIWDKIAERMLLEFVESGFPIFRATTPADQETIETIFRIIVSANQLSLYGPVAEML